MCTVAKILQKKYGENFGKICFRGVKPGCVLSAETLFYRFVFSDKVHIFNSVIWVAALANLTVTMDCRNARKG
jgi:hypothetical protein